MSSSAAASAAPANVDIASAFEVAVAVASFTGSFHRLYTVQDQYYEEILFISFDLVTSNAAGTRTAVVELRDQNLNVLQAIPPAATQAPSTDTQYTFSPVYAVALAPSTRTYAMPLPSLLLPSQYSLWIDTSNGDAADAYTAVTVYTRRYSSGIEQRYDPPPMASPVIV